MRRKNGARLDTSPKRKRGLPHFPRSRFGRVSRCKGGKPAMPDKLGNSLTWRLALLMALLLLSAGCANHWTFFPERHNMLDTARQMSEAAQVPTDVPRELD